MASSSILATYHLARPDLEGARALAEHLALEQTVELPAGASPPGVETAMAGRVQELWPAGPGRWRAVLAFPLAAVGSDPLQLLNVLFGNASLLDGVRLTEVDLPPGAHGFLPGPRLGIPGLRALLAAHGRALLCVAVKPMGLDARALADLCGRLVRAGVDLVKDDHGLADQPTASFRARIRRCQDAVADANAATGGHALYVPNVTGALDGMAERLDAVEEARCRAVLLSPFLAGLDALRWVRQTRDLAVLAHPALSGVFFGPYHGIAPDLLLGRLVRLLGADGVIYPNAGGRFPWDVDTCEAVNRRLRERLGGALPSFPVPGGGIAADRVPDWLERYGPDTIFLVGGSLYAGGDPEGAAARLVERLKVGS